MLKIKGLQFRVFFSLCALFLFFSIKPALAQQASGPRPMAGQSPSPACSNERQQAAAFRQRIVSQLGLARLSSWSAHHEAVLSDLTPFLNPELQRYLQRAYTSYRGATHEAARSRFLDVMMRVMPANFSQMRTPQQQTQDILGHSPYERAALTDFDSSRGGYRGYEETTFDPQKLLLQRCYFYHMTDASRPHFQGVRFCSSRTLHGESPAVVHTLDALEGPSEWRAMSSGENDFRVFDFSHATAVPFVTLGTPSCSVVQPVALLDLEDGESTAAEAQ